MQGLPQGCGLLRGLKHPAPVGHSGAELLWSRLRTVGECPVLVSQGPLRQLLPQIRAVEPAAMGTVLCAEQHTGSFGNKGTW